MNDNGLIKHDKKEMSSGDPRPAKKSYANKKKELAAKMKHHYSNENQRKMHHDSIKKVVKKEHRGPRYEAINRAYPVEK